MNHQSCSEARNTDLNNTALRPYINYQKISLQYQSQTYGCYITLEKYRKKEIHSRQGREKIVAYVTHFSKHRFAKPNCSIVVEITTFC